MSNSGENELVSDQVKSEDGPNWLTPAQAADQLGVNHRYVYRLIESGELESDGKKHGQRITRESVETARIKRLLTASSDVNFTGELASSGEVQHELSKRENNQMGAIALQGIQGERDKLLELYNQAQVEWRSELSELQEQWRADIHRVQDERRKEAVESAMSISQLTERVKTLEAQLQAAQPLPQPTPAPEVAAPVTITPTAENVPEPPKKRRWWQF